MLTKKEEVTENAPVKRKKSILIIGGAVLVVFIIFLIGSLGGGQDYISIVKNGYLGEYTDISVSELLEGYYAVFCEDIKWDGGTTDNGENVVAFYAESESLGTTKIQFKMHDDETFKVSAFEGDGIGSNTSEEIKFTDIAALLNFLYQYNKLQGIDNDAQMEKIDSLDEQLSYISGSSVLYGASEDYSGDRSKLCEIYGDAPLDMSAKDMVDYYMDE
ncbi:hypothetical protein D7V86_26140 [bacterium D16-51]|nr:hypothetical protein D7V96_26670 [bacterium D16-59]RKI52096.1 hypothetical protein D7V86_26140 [bacterium D16-51]